MKLIKRILGKVEDLQTLLIKLTDEPKDNFLKLKVLNIIDDMAPDIDKLLRSVK